MNYVGVAETLGVSSSAQASGLAADNLLCAVYFAYVFHLGRNSPADLDVGPSGASPDTPRNCPNIKLLLLETT